MLEARLQTRQGTLQGTRATKTTCSLPTKSNQRNLKAARYSPRKPRPRFKSRINPSTSLSPKTSRPNATKAGDISCLTRSPVLSATPPWAASWTTADLTTLKKKKRPQFPWAKLESSRTLGGEALYRHTLLYPITCREFRSR